MSLNIHDRMKQSDVFQYSW